MNEKLKLVEQLQIDQYKLSYWLSNLVNWLDIGYSWRYMVLVVA